MTQTKQKIGILVVVRTVGESSVRSCKRPYLSSEEGRVVRYWENLVSYNCLLIHGDLIGVVKVFVVKTLWGQVLYEGYSLLVVEVKGWFVWVFVFIKDYFNDEHCKSWVFFKSSLSLLSTNSCKFSCITSKEIL